MEELEAYALVGWVFGSEGGGDHGFDGLVGFGDEVGC